MVLSDTHGLLRESVISRIEGTDLILHAGDVGDPAILDQLKRFAPLHVVRGNIDRGAFVETLSLSEIIELDGGMIYMTHDIAALNLDPSKSDVRLVVFGHSHAPAFYEKDGVGYLNPGSVGPRRFKLPISFAKVDWSDGRIDCQIVTLET